MNRRLSQHASPPGFTLVELVVVVALIAACAGMLLPALARTRPNVRSVQCLNNLKQWGAGLQIYANSSADNLPRDGLGANGTYPGFGTDGTPNDLNAWFNLLPQLIGDSTLQSYANSGGPDPRTKFPFPGGKGRVWHCPSASMSGVDYLQLSGGGANGFFSYEMNIDLKKLDAITSVAYPAMPKLTTFQRPSATVLFFDGAFNPRTEVVNSSPSFNSVNPASRWRSFAPRHGNGGSIVFLDGQVRIFSGSYVTNGASTFEALRPDIIWNAPYRVANP